MAGNAQLSEGSILRGTLLPPSPLPIVLTLQSFTVLFPALLRDNPQIPVLYRALQYERALDIDLLRENIASEERRGKKQQIEILRAKVEGAAVNPSYDADDREGTSTLPQQDALMDDMSDIAKLDYKPHSVLTIVSAIDEAITVVQSEISSMDAVADQLQTQLENTIGDLSDLRYGKLSRPGLRRELVESLNVLATTCNRKCAGDISIWTE